MAGPGREQVGKKGWEQADVAAGPLFVRVDPAALQARRTYATFTALLNNYERCVRCTRLPEPRSVSRSPDMDVAFHPPQVQVVG